MFKDVVTATYARQFKTKSLNQRYELGETNVF